MSGTKQNNCKKKSIGQNFHAVIIFLINAICAYRILEYCYFVASHLPFNRNGFKFFTNAGGLGKADIKEILERAADFYRNLNSTDGNKGRGSATIEQVDYMSVYASDLVKAVRKAAGNKGTII